MQAWQAGTGRGGPYGGSQPTSWTEGPWRVSKKQGGRRRGAVAPLEHGPGRGHGVPARLERAAHLGQVARRPGLLERLLGLLQVLIRPGVLVDRLGAAGLLGLEVDVEVAEVVGERVQVLLGGLP